MVISPKSSFLHEACRHAVMGYAFKDSKTEVKSGQRSSVLGSSAGGSSFDLGLWLLFPAPAPHRIFNKA